MKKVVITVSAVLLAICGVLVALIATDTISFKPSDYFGSGDW